MCASLASYRVCGTIPYPDRLLGNKVCSVGRIATVTAGVSLLLATVLVITTVVTEVLRLRVLSLISSTSDLA